jgi:hypothetical protein
MLVSFRQICSGRSHAGGDAHCAQGANQQLKPGLTWVSVCAILMGVTSHLNFSVTGSWSLGCQVPGSYSPGGGRLSLSFGGCSRVDREMRGEVGCSMPGSGLYCPGPGSLDLGSCAVHSQFDRE